jgi:hypothetical protein
MPAIVIQPEKWRHSKAPLCSEALNPTRRDRRKR